MYLIAFSRYSIIQHIEIDTKTYLSGTEGLFTMAYNFDEKQKRASESDMDIIGLVMDC